MTIRKGAIKNLTIPLCGKLANRTQGTEKFFKRISHKFSTETLEKSFNKIFPQIFYGNYCFMYVSKAIKFDF